jgi:hypothetical protein
MLQHNNAFAGNAACYQGETLRSRAEGEPDVFAHCPRLYPVLLCLDFLQKRLAHPLT